MLTSILAALVAFGTTAKAQDYPDEYLGLPGDNLNLYAVMKLFQESETLEGFERKLNEENSRINNLDLNGDNLIDYITVTDYPEGDDHTIVLRVALNRKEFQDVAVFTVQKFRNGSVQIQLIGDEALYGKNYIIEPIYEETPNPGYMGRPVDRTYVTVVRTTPYEIAYWPVIRYIYMPDYVVWRSSWYWGYYPAWWSPWSPYSWHYYYGYHYNWYDHYYGHYHHWNVCRWGGYHDFYYTRVRVYSPTVVVNITKNVYRDTYSRPDQRKEGEALYTRVNPERGTRTMQSRESGYTNRQPAGVNRESTRSSVSQRTAPESRSAQTARTQQAQTRTGSTARTPESSNRSGAAARTPQSSSRSSETARAPQSSSSKSSPTVRSSQGSSRSSATARSSSGSSRSSSGTRASSSSGQRSSAGRSSSSSSRSSSSGSSKSGSSESRSRSR